jgi:hypothetical protein
VFFPKGVVGYMRSRRAARIIAGQRR